LTTSLAILFVVGFGYLAVALWFAIRQDQLFFQPKRGLAATPDAADLDFEDLALTTPDGISLHAWWLPRPAVPAPDLPGTALTVLYLHGANTNLGDRVDALRYWHDLGFEILALDYRGYGRSSGRPSETGLYTDVETAWHWLTDRRDVPADHVLVVAESMGASLATHLASQVQPAGLVLEAGFTRAADVAVRRYRWLPVRQLIRIQLASEDRIGRIRCPKLLIHSIDDRTVPFTLARRLERRAAPPRDLLKIRGTHARACLEGGPRFHAGLRRWLAGLETRDGVA
jgi:pimeloyl-ACP methyl ester carboxylesterase